MKSAKTSGNTINRLLAIKNVTHYESIIFNNYIVQHVRELQPIENIWQKSRFADSTLGG